MAEIPARDEIDDDYTWDLESIYQDDDAWETEYEAVQERLQELEQYEGKLLDDAEMLHESLQLRDEISRTVSKLGVYAHLRHSEDTSREEYQAMLGRARSLSSKASTAKSFIRPELQEATPEEIEAFMEEEEDLQVYDQYFDDLFRTAEYTLDQETEEVISQLGEVFGQGDYHGALLDTDLEFPTVEQDGDEVEITQGNLTSLLKDGDREFRKDVYDAFFETLGGFETLISKFYDTEVKEDVNFADIRGYDSARHRALSGSNIPEDVYDNLIETVRDNLDLLHRHAGLKEEALDVDELQMWDLYTPIVDSEEPELEFEEAKEHVIQALEPLGEDYQQRAREGLEDEDWVDVFENRDKRSGAFSSGTYDTQPFILMNFKENISSMYTLAHELGHSMHSDLSSSEQPYPNSGYPIFTAEVASTVNEALLTEHLLEEVEDEEFRKHVVDNALERFRSTLYRQTMFAEFEHRAHQMGEEGQPLTADTLNDLYRGLKEDYYDPAEVDDRIENEWMRIPHFFRPFYVYQYSTGMSAANALADQILDKDVPGAAERYKDFLRTGSKEYPIELLREAGVDMSSPEPVEDALEVYEERLDQMEELID